jgi:DNA-binding IclR family transcriptional regulator
MESAVKPLSARRQIGSIRVGFRLIRVLEARGRPMSLTELAKTVGMPASQAHLYLVSFLEEGLVWQDPSNSHYQLGPYAIQLGVAAIRETDAFSFTKDALIRLVRETGDSAYASIWTEHGPVIVQKIDGERLTPVSIRVGYIMPLLTSATGRTFLAHLPAVQTHDIVRKELEVLRNVKGGAHRIASTEDVAKLAHKIRAAGIAQTDSLLYSGFVGVAAPILNYNDEICCALTILGPRGVFDSSLDGVPAQVLRHVASDVSARLGALKTPART